jgi:hypothetical protein
VVGSRLDRGIGLGVGAGLFQSAGQGRWVWPTLAMRWAGRHWIFEVGWAEDLVGCGWQPVLAKWVMGACKNLKGEMMGYILQVV